MNTSLGSQNNLLAPSSGNSSPNFTIVTYGQRNYRVRAQEYKKCEIMSFFWGLASVFFLLIDVAILIQDIFSLSGIAVCSVSVGCGVLLSAFTIRHRESLKPVLVFSIVTTTILILGWLILLATKEKGFTLISGIIIFIDLVVSLILLKNKSLVLGKCLLLTQFIMVALKLDNNIVSPWATTLFLLIMLSSAALISGIFVGIFFLISSCVMSTIPIEKKCGLGFIAFLALAISMNSATPLYQVLFRTSMWIGAIVAFVSSCCFIVYIVVFNEGIKLFFCKIQELKTFNHNIQLVPMSKQKIKKYRFEQLSQNWFQKVRLTRKQRKKIEKSEKTEQIGSRKKIQANGQCLVCLENDAQVIWVPCGHLAVCISCCQLMFAKKNACCVLCKLLPSEVYVLETVEKEEKPVQKEIEISFQESQLQREEKPTQLGNLPDLQKSQSKGQCFEGSTNRWFYIRQGYQVHVY